MIVDIIVLFLTSKSKLLFVYPLWETTLALSEKLKCVHPLIQQWHSRTHTLGTLAHVSQDTYMKTFLTVLFVIAQTRENLTVHQQK